ncbi:MAG: transcription factor TFIIIB subunit brf1 [Cirrosporium novae-zelandiae]|nr:MAG: transcription factor TFIIIB subunit brf1 [Cirrosporium novae-zelandiae]
MATPALVLIIGAGSNIGKSVAQKFAANGFRVALASRSREEEQTADGLYHFKVNLTDPKAVTSLFTRLHEKAGIPNVVVYNAAAFNRAPEGPLSVPLDEFIDSQNINIASVYAAMSEAVRGFKKLPNSLAKTFIYTGNILNSRTMPSLFTLGVGKAAGAHMIEAASMAYGQEGYNFYYADERKPTGDAVYNEIDGPAAGEFYLELAKDKTQRPWLATFVKGKGYGERGGLWGGRQEEKVETRRTFCRKQNRLTFYSLCSNLSSNIEMLRVQAPSHRPVSRLASLKKPPIIREQPKARASNPRTCPNPNCPAPNIVDDDDKRVCSGCGTVISDSNIVSEITFGENAAGGAVVQGTFIGADQRHGRNIGPGFKRSGGMESREITEGNGRRYVNQLATALNIPPGVADQAMQIFKLAAGANFIQGRRTRTVAAVCLYIACRKQKENTTMLIDLADVLNINVFKLGAVYSTMLKELLLDKMVPLPVNPEALIYRFAKQLEFGSLQQTTTVAKEAVYILKRMKRDWMLTGRRPAGVCGAALILAARMNNYRRTVREVVYVVKVTDMTLHKRLDEFKTTDSGALTVEEFRNVDLEKEADPPAFSKQFKKTSRKEKAEARAKKSKEKEKAKGQGTGSVPNPEIIDAQPIRRDKDGFVIPPLPIDPSLATSNLAESAVASPIASSTENSAAVSDPALNLSTPPSSIQQTQDTHDILTMADEVDAAMNIPNLEADQSSENIVELMADIPKRKAGRPLGSKNKKPLPPTAEDLQIEEELEEQMLETLQDQGTIDAAASYAETLATEHRGAKKVLETAEVGEDEFADDPEVRDCLLTPQEIAIKEKIWVHENRDWLRNQQAKILKRQLEELNGTARLVKRRRKRKGRMGDMSSFAGDDGEISTPSTPAEATRLMLERRGFSKKINYAKLEDLYKTSDASREGSPAPSSASTGSFIQSGQPSNKERARRWSEREDESTTPEPLDSPEKRKPVEPPKAGNTVKETIEEVMEELPETNMERRAGGRGEGEKGDEGEDDDIEDDDEAAWYDNREEEIQDEDEDNIHRALAGLGEVDEVDEYMGDDYD